MIQVPIVVGLTLCERMEVDKQSRKTSLVGLFQALRFKRFPSPPQNFTAYTILTDGIGEGTMKLSVTRSETGQAIYVFTRWTAFPADRLLPVNVVLPVNGCVFPAPGYYVLTLSFNDWFVTERSLRIYFEEDQA